MDEKQKQLLELRRNRKMLIKKCISILNSKNPKGVKIKKYYAFVRSNSLLNNELDNHLKKLLVISLNEFSISKEIQFLKSLI